MRVISIITLFLIGFQIHAQVSRTLYTNDKEVVGLIFPSAIRQAVVGSENFTFSYNRENLQHIGLLQGLHGSKSNLLVITENGDVFSYLLAYQKKLDTLTHFVKSKERIGSEIPNSEIIYKDTLSKSIAGFPSTFPNKALVDYQMEYFKKFSRFHLENNKNRLRKKRKDGLVLRLRDLVYDRTEVYAVMEIKNKSGIDFETDYLRIYKINGNKRRKSSYQKMILEPLLAYDFPAIVKDGKKAAFVMVLSKFTLGDSEKLLFELNEQNGSRVVELFKR